VTYRARRPGPPRETKRARSCCPERRRHAGFMPASCRLHAAMGNRPPASNRLRACEIAQISLMNETVTLACAVSSPV